MGRPHVPPRYRSYLLRLWEERLQSGEGSASWRFSLEDTHNGQRRGFAGLEALMDYLIEQIGKEESATQEFLSSSSAEPQNEESPSA